MFLRYFLVILAIFGIFTSLVVIHFLNMPGVVSHPSVPPTVNPFSNSIVASGIVEALNENVSVGIPQAGLITNVFVKVGDTVKADEPLFELDSRDLNAELAIQSSNIGVLEATLRRLEDQLERLKSIKDPRAISQDEIKTRTNDVAIAKTQIEKAKREKEKTQVLIDRLTIRAPREGVVLQVKVRKGEFAALTPTEPAMILGNLNKMQVRVDIDEQNASRLTKNMVAVAFTKNKDKFEIPLTFERIEPYVIPKKSLTGASDERTDTRVLQVIYTFLPPKNFSIYVGQQVDVFIKAN
jgi:RND family efflux transporter MFP subunit